ASALGCNSRSDGTSSSADTSISANSTPKSGWSTPSCCCTADDVSPILRPTTTAPAAIRRADQLLLHRVRRLDVGVTDQRADGWRRSPGASGEHDPVGSFGDGVCG